MIRKLGWGGGDADYHDCRIASRKNYNVSHFIGTGMLSVNTLDSVIAVVALGSTRF